MNQSIYMAKLSLQEQMLKAGLVSEKKLKKAKSSSKKSRTLKKEIKESVSQSKAEQTERAKALNKEQQEERLAKEIKAQIKQLIETNKLDNARGEIKHNFTDGTLIKHIYVEEYMRKQLLAGVLAIVKYGEIYALIPNVVAEKIAQREPELIIESQSNSDESVEEDDPYADYVVPDDLMW